KRKFVRFRFLCGTSGPMIPRWSLVLLTAACLLTSASCSRKPVLTRQDHLNWNTATLTSDYEKTGHKDPKWDDSAREALKEYATIMTGNDPDAVLRRNIVGNSAEAAIHAGCD